MCDGFKLEVDGGGSGVVGCAPPSGVKVGSVRTGVEGDIFPTEDTGVARA